MLNTAKLLPNHTIEYWRVNETDLLHPLHTKENEMRGGAPMCAPMFSVQQIPIVGCDLPLHGILMYQNDAEVTHDKSTNTWTATTKHHADEKFAWGFTAVTTITTTDTSLHHTFMIERHADCNNNDQMPLSLGFHPYFNTYGEDFVCTIGAEARTKTSIPATIIDSEFSAIPQNKTATLTTKVGTISIETDGYDEYCLWTDAIDTYFCIEPIYQYRSFGLPQTGLSAGERKKVRCVLTFNPPND